MSRDVEQEQRLLRELQGSGKSIAEFGRERGIQAHRLYALTKRAMAPARGGLSMSPPNGGNFVKVPVLSSGGEKEREQPARLVTIIVSESLRIEVPINEIPSVLSVLGVSL